MPSLTTGRPRQDVFSVQGDPPFDLRQRSKRFVLRSSIFRQRHGNIASSHNRQESGDEWQAVVAFDADYGTCRDRALVEPLAPSVILAQQVPICRDLRVGGDDEVVRE